MTDDGDLNATRTATRDPAGTDERSAADVGPATVIGRFAVLAEVGSGGMGLVYSAYDPQLDRRVALKLLHSRGDPLERQRLVREAQALARLAHPNVVAVHDVGSHGDHLFVAMEFVEGATLREWVDTHPVGDAGRYARALEILRDAGRGIEAAHAAGLVHRDIKPRNILVGNDGRVRVVDFGLARGEVESDGDEHMRETARQSLQSSGDSASRSAGLIDVALTQTGKIVGTPAYMAPEQFQAGAIDHRADQFSFCVTAWEVLFGLRPFAGNAVSILSAIHGGAIERPPAIEVAPALEQALRRGLAYRAARRHADMRTLLAVLDDELGTAQGRRRPRASKRAWFVAAGAVVTAGIIAWRAGTEAPACVGAEAHLVGVWDDVRKAAIREAMIGTDASFAGGAWSRLETNADAWRTAWIEGHRDACEASVVRNEQSAALMDLRMACLASRRQEMVAYLDLLATPTLDAIANADEGFDALAAVDRCADPEYVQHRGERPEDPADAAREDELLAEVARAAALRAAADHAGAVEVAKNAAATATMLALERAEALALIEWGRALAVSSPSQAREHLERAHALAVRHAWVEVAARASLHLADVIGVQQHSFGDARVWLRFARGGADQLADRTLAARVDVLESALLSAQGRYADAVVLGQAALESMASDPSRSGKEYARALAGHALNLSLTAREHEALALAEQALAAGEEASGADHPTVATLHHTLSRVRVMNGDLEGARDSARRGIEIIEKALGPRNRMVVVGLIRLALVDQARGARESSLESIAAAKAIGEHGGVEAPTLALLLELEGDIRLDLGEHARAEAAYIAALDLQRASYGERHPATATTQIELGAIECLLGRQQVGLRRMQVGLALAEDLLGTQHPELAVIYDRFGSTAKADGKLDEAETWYRRALGVVEATSGPQSTAMLDARASMCEVTADLLRADEAIEHCRIASALARERSPIDPLRLAAIENNFGAALVAADRYADARERYEAAIDLWSDVLGESSMHVAIGLANLGEALFGLADLEGARVAYARSLEIREELAGVEHPSLLPPLIGLSTTANARGAHDDALAHATRAHLLASRPGADARNLARAQAALAIALAAKQRSTPKRSLELAREALATFERLGSSGNRDADRIRVWLRGR